jgi:glycosyltransferase involved in cell wall biosynthesis
LPPEKPDSPQLSIVMAITGRYTWVEEELARTLTQLEQQGLGLPVEIIAACGGAKWLTAPLLQTLSVRFGRRLTLLTVDDNRSPAALFNCGIGAARADQVLCVWPGCRPDLTHILSAIQDETQDRELMAWVPPDWIDKLGGPQFAESWAGYFLQCHNILKLSSVVIRRESFLELGGFDTVRLLQRYFDWEFWLRAVGAGMRVHFEPGAAGSEKWDWTAYPLESDERVPRLVAQSYCLRVSRTAPNRADPNALRRDFLADLPPAERRAASRALNVPDGEPAQGEQDAPPLRIGVISGQHDYVHTQLCFLNYFELLQGTGTVTWNCFLDVLVCPERDLQALDVVIISRGRVENVLSVLDYCRLHGIPTLYMIDDNWFWVSKDWPEHYAALFAPDSTAYQVFTSCLSRASAVLVYNRMLADDVRPWARRVIQLSTNIRQEQFRRPLIDAGLAQTVAALRAWRSAHDGLIIGYAGSVRYTDVHLEAVVRAVGECDCPIKVFLFGHLLPRQLELLDGAEVVSLPYVPYETYASVLGELEPDIMLAPLDESRTSMSKAPNKYLEYSVVGAAGIYSNIHPYSEVIRDEVNGLLVGSSVEAWQEAIVRLARDHDLRRRIAARAQRDVLTQYETAVSLPKFVDAIRSLAGRKV